MRIETFMLMRGTFWNERCRQIAPDINGSFYFTYVPISETSNNFCLDQSSYESQEDSTKNLCDLVNKHCSFVGNADKFQTKISIQKL